MANVTEIKIQGCQLNTSLNCYPHVEQQNNYSIPLITLSMFVGVLALVFNSCILVLIVRENKIRLNLYHFLVLMLCVSDFVVGLAFVFAILRQLLPAVRTSKVFAVLNSMLMTLGVSLSLYHTFLISLQRCLVICKEKWNNFVFHKNRKYIVYVSGWIVILISNCLFISPPPDSPTGDIISYAYNGHYKAFSIYMRSLTLALLFSTVLLYARTIVYMLKTYSPNKQSNALQVIKTIDIHMTEPHASKNTCTSSSLPAQVKVKPMKSRGEQSKIDTLRRKKVMSTLYLVGLLITLLLIFTGPFLVTQPWHDTLSIRFKGILFCLCCINSTLNPIIYVWKLVDIRGIVKSALFCSKT